MRNFLRLSVAIASSILVLTMSVAAQADVLADADALYLQREAGRDKIEEARVKYVSLLPQLSGASLIRVVSQLGRLALYEGEMTLPKDATAERKRIFRDCWETYVEKINPSIVGDHPAYFYFKGMCLAYWGEAAGTLASLPYVPVIVDMINRGLQSDTRFEGGGIYRIAAGVYVNRQARPLGLYRPDQALVMIDNALAASAYPGDPHSGNVYFDNWRGRGLVLAELTRNDEARMLLTGKIADIDSLEADEELPRGREPEARWNRAQMAALLEELN